MRLSFIYLFLCVITMGNAVWGNVVAGDIKGRVIDATSNEPLDFVNVTLRKKGVEGALPMGTTTDLDGNFVLTNIPNDTYLLQISFIGYQTYEQEITLTAGVNAITLPPVFLSEDTQVLSEVQVVGMRSQMRFEIDKKVFNVDQSLASAGGSASDILTNIPSVEVDNEGEISLRGNSSVTIWINGKASGLSADNRAQILEQLPAESIERIEVITNRLPNIARKGRRGLSTSS